jgi:hypothetical protein
MWPFRRKQESPQEIAAEEKLDEVTREVAADELQTEADRELDTGLGIGELARFGHPREFQRIEGDALQEPIDDADPRDEHALREALRDDDAKK